MGDLIKGMARCLENLATVFSFGGGLIDQILQIRFLLFTSIICQISADLLKLLYFYTDWNVLVRVCYPLLYMLSSLFIHIIGKYWAKVADERRKRPYSILLADKNAPNEEVWRQVTLLFLDKQSF